MDFQSLDLNDSDVTQLTAMVKTALYGAYTSGMECHERLGELRLDVWRIDDFEERIIQGTLLRVVIQHNGAVVFACEQYVRSTPRLQ